MRRKSTDGRHRDARHFWSWGTVGQRLFGIYLVTVFVLIVCVAPVSAYAYKRSTALMNPLYCALAALALIGGCHVTVMRRLQADVARGPMVRGRLAKYRSRPWAFPVIISVGAAALFLLQMLILRKAPFTVGWDVYSITSPEASKDQFYFSTYPNQLFLAGVFEKLRLFGMRMGAESGYKFLVAGSCLCVTLSVVLMTFVAKRLKGTGVAYVCFAVAAVFIELSPWAFVPYSDTYGMLFTTLIIWCYVCCPVMPIRWFAIALCSYIGYSIKPTVIFALLAIVSAEVFTVVSGYVRSHKTGSVRSSHTFGVTGSPRHSATPTVISPTDGGARRTAVVMLSMAGALLGFILGGVMVSHVSLKLVDGVDGARKFSMTHYLMMGFNLKDRGIYSREDFDYSASQPNPQARQDANLRVFKERLTTTRFDRAVSLLADKTCTNYADGTFTWKLEGGSRAFRAEEPAQKTFIGKIYGLGADDSPIAPIYQIMWLAILLGALACLLSRGPAGKYVNMAAFSLLFLSAFLTIFECRGRYVFLYSPYFVLLAAVGWRQMVDWMYVRISKLH